MNIDSEHIEIPDNDTEKLIEVLGLTNNLHEAGYILPDGSLLHLDRSNCIKRKNHLDILKMLPAFFSENESIIDNDMIKFMAKEQLIRFSIDGTVHTAAQPTSEQLRKIYKILAYRSDPFEITLSNAAGMTLVQHTVSGPSMSALVSIFNEYREEEHLSEDEFCVEEDNENFKLIFRPAMKIVGRINKLSNTMKIQPLFKKATPLFMRLAKQLHNSH